MSIRQNKVNAFRDLLSTKSLKTSEVDYSIFTSNVLEMTKTVDKPDDYYMEGDDITFNITLKNNGNKIIRNFVIKDELESTILPIDNNEYMVTTTHGIITQENNVVIISEITLSPGEDAMITISGVIAEAVEETVENEIENIEEDLEDEEEIEYFSFNEKDY